MEVPVLSPSCVSGEVVTGGIVVGGVSDLFLRLPAIKGGSGGRSGGGDPDIGGEGKEAQAGTMGFGSTKSILNLDWSMLERCR